MKIKTKFLRLIIGFTYYVETKKVEQTTTLIL